VSLAAPGVNPVAVGAGCAGWIIWDSDMALMVSRLAVKVLLIYQAAPTGTSILETIDLGGAKILDCLSAISRSGNGEEHDALCRNIYTPSWPYYSINLPARRGRCAHLGDCDLEDGKPQAGALLFLFLMARHLDGL
jgi:hypothetical protein